MHRNWLLQRLKHYGRRYPEEQYLLSRMRAFVETHTDCFERSLVIGHITSSCWLMDPRGTSVLLTHHRKLGRWLQLGGHSDGDSNSLQVALREAEEESGLARIRPVSGEIFDIDIHPIPERDSEAEHLHYDVRFALQALDPDGLTVSDESHALSWVPLAQLEDYTSDASILRMAAKWSQVQQG